MESLSIAGGIIKVAKAIVKAASGVRQCKSRCQYLARRVEVIAELVRESEAAPSDSATRTRVLDRLRDALEEALEVVQSCGSSSFPKLLLAGSSTNSSIDNVERKINNCLLELGVANDVRLLGLGNQLTTAARRLAVHDAVPRPRPKRNTVVNNSGIMKINALPRPNTVLNNSGIMKINAVARPNTVVNNSGIVKINAVARPNTVVNNSGIVKYFGDSSSSCCSRNGTKEDSVAAIQNNSTRVSVPAGGSSGHASDGDDDFNCNARKQKQDATAMPMRGNRCYDKKWQAATTGKRMQKAAAPDAGPQMLSTTSPAASGKYRRATSAPPGRDFHPRRSKSNASRSTGNQVSFPDFQANGPWTPLPQGLQDCQYPNGGAGDHGGLVRYYCNHYSIEDDPNSCSIM